MPGEMQQLEALKRQRETHNEAWERMQSALLRLRDVCFEVPREPLNGLDQDGTSLSHERRGADAHDRAAHGALRGRAP